MSTPSTQPEHSIYPIGTPGQPWQAAEKALWLAQQSKKRSYTDDVVEPLKTLLASAQLSAHAQLVEYGTLDYQHLGLPAYPLLAIRSKVWQRGVPTVLVTGGVHGYETSGVHGAIRFVAERFVHYTGSVNLVVLPCISPWGYETINRWNPEAVDPNRSFVEPSPSAEARCALRFVNDHANDALVHIDLHETTDTDNSEFHPAKAARDGTVSHYWNIPDGYYLVGDTEKLTPEFHRAIIEAVGRVTQIAEADESGLIIGETLVQPGVINYAKKSLGLCGGMTGAPYVGTTEVYPDSPSSSPELCNRAQVVTVCAAIDFALGEGGP